MTGMRREVRLVRQAAELDVLELDRPQDKEPTAILFFLVERVQSTETLG